MWRIPVIVFPGIFGASLSYLLVWGALDLITDQFSKRSFFGGLIGNQLSAMLEWYVLPTAIAANILLLGYRYFLNTKHAEWDDCRRKWFVQGAEHGLALMFIPVSVLFAMFLVFFFLPTSWLGFITLLYSIWLYAPLCIIGGIASVSLMCEMRRRALKNLSEENITMEDLKTKEK